MATGGETKYAMNGDLAVAYRSVGDAGPDMMFVGNWFTNVELIDKVPYFKPFFESLASIGRVIFFDQAGSGASDPVTFDALPSLEQWTDSVRVVLDAVGSERTALLALDGAFSTAALFAATYPARTSALISLAGYAATKKADDYPIGLSEENFEEVLNTWIRLWGTGEGQHLFNPDWLWNEEIRAQWGQGERLAASPGVISRMLRLSMSIDVRHVLPLIRVPTLILQHADNPLVSLSGPYLADHIPDSKFVSLPGRNFYPVGPDAVEEISEFVTGRRSTADEERVLATVLFTDIVDSTKKAAEIGDRDWRALLDAHDAVVRAQLARFRGREVKTVGDGFLATFDGPARAIKCAVAIRDAVRALGLDVRAGVHTGEVEIRGEDVGGIAVHIGARVSSQAHGGEILVSSTVKDLVVGSGLSFEERGARELKGVPGTWNLYAVAA